MTRLPRQLSGIALAITLHLLAAVWWLASGGTTVAPSLPLQTLNVSLLSAVEETPAPPAPAIQPRLPTPKKPAPTPPREVATPARNDTPAAETMPVASPTQQIAPAAPAPSAASGTPSEAPAIVPPKFDAAYLANPAPHYPGMSRRLNETGRVLLRVKVSTEGLPTEVDIAQTSGYARLDEAAREAVRGWKFVPARQGERAVAAAVLVPIVFKLN